MSSSSIHWSQRPFHQAVERPWLLRWYSQDEFQRLLRNAGFQIDGVLGENGKPVADDAPAFVFIARRPSGSGVQPGR